MEHNYAFSMGRVCLVPLSEQESQQYRVIRNRKENRDNFVFSGCITKEEQKSWYKKYIESPNDVMFAIYDNSRRFIGGNALYNINEENGSCEYGRLLIDKQLCKNGNWGFEATIAALKVAFTYMNLKKVYLEVFSDNLAAYKTYLKSGFIVKYVNDAVDEKKLVHMEIEESRFQY